MNKNIHEIIARKKLEIANKRREQEEKAAKEKEEDKKKMSDDTIIAAGDTSINPVVEEPAAVVPATSFLPSDGGPHLQYKNIYTSFSLHSTVSEKMSVPIAGHKPSSLFMREFLARRSNSRGEGDIFQPHQSATNNGYVTLQGDPSRVLVDIEEEYEPQWKIGGGVYGDVYAATKVTDKDSSESDSDVIDSDIIVDKRISGNNYEEKKDRIMNRESSKEGRRRIDNKYVDSRRRYDERADRGLDRGKRGRRDDIDNDEKRDRMRVERDRNLRRRYDDEYDHRSVRDRSRNYLHDRDRSEYNDGRRSTKYRPERRRDTDLDDLDSMRRETDRCRRRDYSCSRGYRGNSRTDARDQDLRNREGEREYRRDMDRDKEMEDMHRRRDRREMKSHDNNAIDNVRGNDIIDPYLNKITEQEETKVEDGRGHPMSGRNTEEPKKLKKEKKLYAIKEIKDSWISESHVGFPSYLLREFDLLMRLRHPNVLYATQMGFRDYEVDRPEEVTQINMTSNGRTPQRTEEGKCVSEQTVLNDQSNVPLEKNKTTNIKRSFYIITEYAGYDLKAFLYPPRTYLHLSTRNAHPDAPRALVSKIKCVAQQLLQGLDFLHQHQVVHRDLKTSNILVDKKGIVRICDFGLSRFFTEGSALTQKVITIVYRPPELHFGVNDYSSKVDIWSAACIIAELVLRVPLFRADSELDHLAAICDVLGDGTFPDDVVTFPGLLYLRSGVEMLTALSIQRPDLFSDKQKLKVNERKRVYYANLKNLDDKIDVDNQRSNSQEYEHTPYSSSSSSEQQKEMSARINTLAQNQAETLKKYFHNHTSYLPLRARKECTAEHLGGSQFFDLLARMLMWNPRDRLSAAEALTHPWFTTEPFPYTDYAMLMEGIPFAPHTTSNILSATQNPPPCPMNHNPQHSNTTHSDTFMTDHQVETSYLSIPSTVTASVVGMPRGVFLPPIEVIGPDASKGPGETVSCTYHKKMPDESGSSAGSVGSNSLYSDSGQEGSDNEGNEEVICCSPTQVSSAIITTASDKKRSRIAAERLELMRHYQEEGDSLEPDERLPDIDGSIPDFDKSC